MSSTGFPERHSGVDEKEIFQMLKSIGSTSLDALINETVPSQIRLKSPMPIEEGLHEHEYLAQLKAVSMQNKVFRSYIGLGYYDCITPSVILRNIFENPGWYTAYTPYQAEIAQGRLEALLNFQTMVIDLTGMEIANASLLDEGTAAAEAMLMFFHNTSNVDCRKFFVSEECFPQTISVLKTRSAPLGIQLIIGDHRKAELSNEFFGALLQYPAANGQVYDYRSFMAEAAKNEIQVAVAADILSLTLLTPPGEWGADAVVGTTQRLGIPMGFGGPHAAYFASKEKYKRIMPGRIIGVSMDAKGNRALRMALQTREQHIRRDKATSNICTSQVLLAVMAGMYGAYHGREGLIKIATRINSLAYMLSDKLSALGYSQLNTQFFDTIYVRVGEKQKELLKLAVEAEMNFRCPDSEHICITLDETATAQDVNEIVEIFSKNSKTTSAVKSNTMPLQAQRSAFMTHPVFNSYHSETEMMRYLKRLENKDLSLVHSMIPLGSCTMKLNAASEMIPLSWTHFSRMHPFAPFDQTKGYRLILDELEKLLCIITGMHAVSLQPNSGAQGEYAGLMVIRAYHQSRNDSHRTIALIPSSAHGTNPATAVMCGMKVVVVKCDARGNIDIQDLKTQAEIHKDNLGALMVTYPSTHGVYEEGIQEITKIVHDHGGQVYMDGANMNAQVGLTNPAMIGADVCHLNLHKTFAIPHGGGGPGMGPIAVAKHLAPFLPTNPLVKTGGEKAIDAVSAAPFGSASILLISYGYIKMLGGKGMTEATRNAILNANYLKAKLESHFPVLYSGTKNRVAHEMILDCRAFKTQAGIEVEDIAKRLMDYGFHAPTVSFPVAGTLMIEPTESESKAELDRFCEAMISIRNEITEIAEGRADKVDNVLKNAPHTASEVITENWEHSYTREKAVFPLPWVRESKFFPPVSRIDNAYGDRNLVCACPSIESYSETLA